MADWMNEPPKKEELASGGSWMDAPPGDDEIRGYADLGIEPEQKHSKKQTALEGFGNGISMGYLPHLQAGAESLGDLIGSGKDKALDAVGLDKYASVDHQLEKDGFQLPDSGYVKSRDENIKRQKDQATENPWTAGTANVAGALTGGIASAPLFGVANSTRALPAITRLADGKRAFDLGRVGQAAMTGATVGVLANPGDTKGEISPMQLKERAVNGAIGAGIGGGLQGGLEVGGKLAPVISDNAKKAALYLQDKAEKLKVKSLGGTKKMLEKLQSTPGAENRLGRNLLDNKVGGFFTGKEKVAGQIDDLAIAKTGELTGEIDRVSALQNSVDPEKALALEAAKFNPREAAESLKQEIRDEYSHIPEEILEPQLKAVDQWFSKPGRMDIKDVQAFKTQMNKFIRNGSYLKDNPGLSQETVMGVRGKLQRGVEHNADVAAELFGEAGGKIKSTNQDLGGLFQAQDMIESGVAAGGKNQMISLGDKVMATAGAAADGGWGLGLGLVNKVAREKGNQISAHSLDAAAKFLMKTPRFAKLAQDNPRAFHALASDTAKKGKDNAPQIMKAAGFDPTKPGDDEKARSAFTE